MVSYMTAVEVLVVWEYELALEVLPSSMPHLR